MSDSDEWAYRVIAFCLGVLATTALVWALRL